MLNFIGDVLFNAHVTRHRRKTLAKIRQHGWTATYVGDEAERQLDFAYTIGFSDHGAPELVVFDLPVELADYIFWHVYDLVKKSGGRLADGFRLVPQDPGTPGFECVFRDATHPDTWSNYIFDAIHYAQENGRSDRPEAMQIVWPSADTLLYPWDPDCPQLIIDAQPQLYQSPPPTFG